MSSKVKQANFRLPLEYMSMIDEFAKNENITKANVITRALDCMQASYDAGNGGMPITAATVSADNQDIADLQEKLAQAEARAAELQAQLDAANERANAAEARANDAVLARDTAEAKAREVSSNQADAAAAASAASAAESAASAEEIARLKALVSTHEETIAEKSKALGAKEAELASKLSELSAKTTELASKDSEIATKDAELITKNSAIAERDARISSLTQQLAEANAKAQFATPPTPGMQAVTIDPAGNSGEESLRALSLLNMLGGVMGAFKQQVDDARQLGEQEGRKKAHEEFKDVVSKARNDGYRDAMTFLDDRITTAREAGAKEERARIANMGFFERRRYLKVHLS